MAQAAQLPRVTLWTGFDNDDLQGATLTGLSSKKGNAVEIKLEKSKEGILETAIIPARFDTAVFSWNVITPAKTSLQLEARARFGSTWSKYYKMGIWSTDPNLSRRSFSRQKDKFGSVETDTLTLSSLADGLQIRVILSSETTDITPTLTGLTAVLSDANQHYQVIATKSDQTAWGKDVAVPMRSQMIYPNGGEVWCSPTSTTMLLEYWSNKLGTKLADTVPEAAKRVWDSTYAGAGNWSFNVAYAASKGTKAYVHRLSSLTEAEKYINKGIPLILSIAWDEGKLDNAALPSSSGHLLVLRGFTTTGDTIVNDPAAATDNQVRRIYKRSQLEKAWIGASGGIVYVIEPKS